MQFYFRPFIQNLQVESALFAAWNLIYASGYAIHLKAQYMKSLNAALEWAPGRNAISYIAINSIIRLGQDAH